MDPTPLVDAPDVVFGEHIEDHIRARLSRLLLAHHPAVRLVHAVATHAEVADGLTEVGRQNLLPRFAVADLVTLGEAVAVGVDPAALFGGVDRAPLA